MLTENLSTLKIHKLTQEQYNRELDAGNIDENAIYVTPDEDIDLSGYATISQLNSKADAEHTHPYLSTSTKYAGSSSVGGAANSATTLTGLTASVAELNYCDGVTSNIQTQIDNLTDYAEGIYDNAIASYDEAAAANASSELVNGIAVYELINKIKNMMCVSYALNGEFSAATDSDYSVTINSVILIGNNLNFELTVERSSNCTAGDIANESIGEIIIDHGGKITGFRRVSTISANYGGVSSFFMANLWMGDDNTLNFTLGLAASQTACKKWSLHFTLPVKLNMDAY